MKKVMTAAVLSCALAAGLMAQSAIRPHNYVQAMTAKLGLSTEQQSQATTIFNNARTTESTLHTSMKMAQQGLSDAVKSNNPAGMEQLSNTVGSLTAQMTLAHAKARAAFYQILTPGQRSTLEQLESQRPRSQWRHARAGSQTSSQ